MKKIFIVIFSFVFVFAGCSVDSFTTFSIKGLEEFYDFRTTSELREHYIREGYIEFTRLNNLYICPFIKEINYEECTLFFYIYALDNSNIEKITISNIVLSDQQNNMLICDSIDEQNIVLNDKDGNLFSSMISCKPFKKTDAWFRDGNNLNLSFQVFINDKAHNSKCFSYDIKIVCNKRAKMPT